MASCKITCEHCGEGFYANKKSIRLCNDCTREIVSKIYLESKDSQSHQQNKSLTDQEILIAAFKLIKRNRDKGLGICAGIECKDCPFFNTNEGEDEDCINDWLLLFNNKKRFNKNNK